MGLISRVSSNLQKHHVTPPRSKTMTDQEYEAVLQIQTNLENRIANIKLLYQKKIENQVNKAIEAKQNNQPVKISDSKITGKKLPIVDAITKNLFKAPKAVPEEKDVSPGSSQLPPLSMFKPLGTIAPMPRFGRPAYENGFEEDNTPKMQEFRKVFEETCLREVPGEYKYNDWQDGKRSLEDFRKSFEFEGEDRPIKICPLGFNREIMNRLKCIKEEKEKKEANGSVILVDLEEKNTWTISKKDLTGELVLWIVDQNCGFVHLDKDSLNRLGYGDLRWDLEKGVFVHLSDFDLSKRHVKLREKTSKTVPFVIGQQVKLDVAKIPKRVVKGQEYEGINVKPMSKEGYFIEKRVAKRFAEGGEVVVNKLETDLNNNEVGPNGELGPGNVGLPNDSQMSVN